MIDNYIREKNLNNGKNYIKVKEIKEIQKKTLNTPSPTRDTTFAQIIDKDDYSNKQNLISFINENNPEFFEKIELGDYINSGSAGVVYRATYKGKNKQQVAIKFLINKKHKENREKKENETKNVNQEIAISKKLHNKNIIEIYAYIKKEQMKYSILEYGKYGDTEHFLKKLLKRSVLGETFLNYIAKQILDGLEYLHRTKTIHMDIKPGNILIDSNLDAKITDFSVSCSYQEFHPEDTVKFPFVGTGRYIAPEILSKSHLKIKQAEKIDIYSFGVTLYYLFYGEYPYKLNDVKSKEYENILKNIQNENLVFPDTRKISDKFKDFLIKILEKDYNKRLTIKDALKHPWIKGCQIIFDEKENLSNQESFLINLITDNIPKFNDYIR